MARGRFISAKISESEQFADLETHEARLMFLMMLPHADVEGRLKADVRYLSGKIFTYLELSRQQIESGLADLERAELIRMYSVKGRRYLYFPKFSEHQIGLRKDREQESEIPSPEDADSEETPPETNNTEGSTQLRSDSGVTPDDVPPKIKVKTKTKIKGEEEVKEKGSYEARGPISERAYGAVAYATSHYVAEWLRDSRGFDFERAYDIWGDQLENLWKHAVGADNRKPGDQAKFRFQDACEGTLDLGVRPKRKGTEEGSAPPKIRFGDVVFHPEQGEFVADFEALYEDAWRCPEGYFIPSGELSVVRSTDA